MLIFLTRFNRGIHHVLHRYLLSVFLLFTRLYIAAAFFKDGWMKIVLWESTLYLFKEEYQVPLLPFQAAAILGVGIELFFPLLLAIGYLSSFSATVLFLFNVIAVYSYPTIWAGGYFDQKLWGMMLLVTMFYGAGKLSVDRLTKSA